MCTAMSIISKNRNVYFGRTMDFSHELNPNAYYVPKNYKWLTESNVEIINKYKFIATGQNIGRPTFADGMNEKGLGIAALYFQGYAHYDKIDDNKLSIAAIDIVNYILGNCENIKEVIERMNEINIVGVEDELTKTIAPLHWVVTYINGECITVEKSENGLDIYNNEVGILANSPSFDWQMTNLNNYINLTNEQREASKFVNLEIKPFGQGAGSIGLPGDYTSPSRFVRLTYVKEYTIVPEINRDVINTFFNIMKSVFIPKGVVLTSRKTYDYTQYTVAMNITKGEYYFNTYNNNQISKIDLNNYNSDTILNIGKLNQ